MAVSAFFAISDPSTMPLGKMSVKMPLPSTHMIVVCGILALAFVQTHAYS